MFDFHTRYFHQDLITCAGKLTPVKAKDRGGYCNGTEKMFYCCQVGRLVYYFRQHGSHFELNHFERV